LQLNVHSNNFNIADIANKISKTYSGHAKLHLATMHCLCFIVCLVFNGWSTQEGQFAPNVGG
jgi:hypothetical protein